MGARFAKWRAVLALGDGIPSRGCIEANAQALARYAALCQEAGLVPVVEPEVLMDGEHTLERCRRGDGGSPANGLQPALHARGDAGGDDPQAQHGASGIDLPRARNGGRGGRRHGGVSLASRPGRRAGDCVPVGRPIRRTGLGPLECHECPIPGRECPGRWRSRSAAPSSNRPWRSGTATSPRVGGTAGPAPSGPVQPGCAPRRIRCRDGKPITIIIRHKETIMSMTETAVDSQRRGGLSRPRRGRGRGAATPRVRVRSRAISRSWAATSRRPMSRTALSAAATMSRPGRRPGR